MYEMNDPLRVQIWKNTFCQNSDTFVLKMTFRL